MSLQVYGDEIMNNKLKSNQINARVCLLKWYCDVKIILVDFPADQVVMSSFKKQIVRQI